jgi:hypothetical protein
MMEVISTSLLRLSWKVAVSGKFMITSLRDTFIAGATCAGKKPKTLRLRKNAVIKFRMLAPEWGLQSIATIFLYKICVLYNVAKFIMVRVSTFQILFNQECLV